MPDIKIRPNSHLEKAGKAFVQEAKNAQARRREDGKKSTEAVVKEACSYFRAKALSRTTLTVSFEKPDISAFKLSGVWNWCKSAEHKSCFSYDPHTRTRCACHCHKRRSTRLGTAKRKGAVKC